VVVFVNEVYLAQPERGKELAPGRYRVLVRKGKTVGRCYWAAVQAGQTTLVEVSWAMDQMLRTTPEWTGFVFPDAGTRERLLPRYVHAFARNRRTDTVYVVGIGVERGRRAVIGQEFFLDNAGPGRVATVAVEPVKPPHEDLLDLARYISRRRDRPPPDRFVEEKLTMPRSSSSAGLLRPLLWTGVAAGAMACGVGVYLIRLDGQASCDSGPCAEVYATRGRGLVALSAGIAVTATSAFFLWRGRERPPSRRLSVTFGDVNGITLGGDF
jgi:hypothetical protein